jgi:hypothetical protein
MDSSDIVEVLTGDTRVLNDDLSAKQQATIFLSYLDKVRKNISNLTTDLFKHLPLRVSLKPYNVNVNIDVQVALWPDWMKDKFTIIWSDRGDFEAEDFFEHLSLKEGNTPNRYIFSVGITDKGKLFAFIVKIKKWDFEDNFVWTEKIQWKQFVLLEEEALVKLFEQNKEQRIFYRLLMGLLFIVNHSIKEREKRTLRAKKLRDEMRFGMRVLFNEQPSLVLGTETCTYTF